MDSFSPAEKVFIHQGYGLERHYTMHNDYLIADPKNDPANLYRSANVDDAMRRIAETGAFFISRADDSGTHNAELQLWATAGIEPYGTWYYELGQGMKKTLITADEKQAYLLIDRATRHCHGIQSDRDNAHPQQN